MARKTHPDVEREKNNKREEKQALLDHMAKQRGYLNDVHRYVATYDLEVAKAINAIPSAVYLAQRSLDPKTKELLFILSMTCLRLPHYVIQGHMRKALAVGATPREILEALELAIPEAGLPTFEHGLTAWAEVVGAETLYAESDVYTEGRGSAKKGQA
ncbi:MAG: carboxymuconolactone decarboxylase family protein [Gammaproteobacteria bacterium]